MPDVNIWMVGSYGMVSAHSVILIIGICLGIRDNQFLPLVISVWTWVSYTLDYQEMWL